MALGDFGLAEWAGESMAARSEITEELEWEQRPRAQPKTQAIPRPFGRIRPIILQPTEWQPIGNQINAAMMLTRAESRNAVL